MSECVFFLLFVILLLYMNMVHQTMTKVKKKIIIFDNNQSKYFYINLFKMYLVCMRRSAEKCAKPHFENFEINPF